MTVFFQKLFECGSDPSQDDTMCRRRLSIFLGQGNMGKIRRRTKTTFLTRCKLYTYTNTNELFMHAHQKI